MMIRRRRTTPKQTEEEDKEEEDTQVIGSLRPVTTKVIPGRHKRSQITRSKNPIHHLHRIRSKRHVKIHSLDHSYNAIVHPSTNLRQKSWEHKKKFKIQSKYLKKKKSLPKTYDLYKMLISVKNLKTISKIRRKFFLQYLQRFYIELLFSGIIIISIRSEQKKAKCFPMKGVHHRKQKGDQYANQRERTVSFRLVE